MFNNIKICMFFVITKTFVNFHLEILFDTIPTSLNGIIK